MGSDIDFRAFLTERGVTLLELLITIVILGILASVVMPLSRMTVKRTKEMELRQALRTVRQAVDEFKKDWDREGESLKGPLCTKNQLTCKEASSVNGYPKSLETLLMVALSGEQATVSGKNVKRYLRKVPQDPLTGSTDWGLRCYQDEPDAEMWCGEDVYDVFTTSEETAIDGTPYREW